jgi:hypothetical protein
MATSSVFYDPDYKWCKRCDREKPLEEFVGEAPASIWGPKEYEICNDCRSKMKGKPYGTRADHERRKAERFARKQRAADPSD